MRYYTATVSTELTLVGWKPWDRLVLPMHKRQASQRAAESATGLSVKRASVQSKAQKQIANSLPNGVSLHSRVSSFKCSLPLLIPYHGSERRSRLQYHRLFRHVTAYRRLLCLQSYTDDMLHLCRNLGVVPGPEELQRGDLKAAPSSQSQEVHSAPPVQL
jgi:hypothetical protein